MNLQPPRTVIGACAVAAALVLSACGTSGGSDASAKDTTTTAAKTSTTAPKASTTTTGAKVTVPAAKAQARADSVDLTVSDFPDGWTATPYSGDGQPSPIQECDPSFADDSTRVARHHTDDYVLGSLDSGDGSQFSAETIVFSSAQAATETVTAFDDPKVVSCVDSKLKDALTSQTGGTVSGTLGKEAVDLGTDQSAGLSARYQIATPGGTTVSATVGLLATSTGDIGTLVSILSIGDNLDASTLKAPIDSLIAQQKSA